MATNAHPGIRLHGERHGPGPGRSLRADRAFKPGEEIALFASPLIAIPSGPSTKSVCSQCLAPRRAAKACVGCRAVAYCGAACQKAHWAQVHKLECKAYRRVRSKAGQDWLPTPVRAVVQILLRWADSDVADAIHCLEGHVQRFTANEKGKEALELQALAACTYAARETTEENLGLATELLCKVHINSFDRSDSDTGDTGTFLDPTLAMANHSCVPNALVAFAGRSAHLRAISPVKAGDEIAISYIDRDFTKPKSFRQQGLERYHFSCSCPRCVDDLDVYQVAQNSPVASLNVFSFVPNPNSLFSPDIDVELFRDVSFRAEVDKMYTACSPEVRIAPEVRLANLRQQWRLCQPLVGARLWAIEPLAHVFQEAINYYAEQQNYLHALCLECFVTLYSDPFKYVAPFMPWRLKGLLLIAKTLTNTAVPSEAGFRNIHPGIMAALSTTDEGSLYQAILLMVVHYGPMAHSETWDILETARSMLEDIEGLEGRRAESAILREWVRNPQDGAADRFFRERVLDPVTTLAGLALEILKTDLEP